MKKFPLLVIALFLTILGTSCLDDNTPYNDYKEWADANQTWLSQQAQLTENGTPYYTRVNSPADDGSYVLIHYFNDRKATEGNLSPKFTSTVDVKYIGRLYNDEPFDSSFLNVSPADSIFRTKLSNVITGWQIALQDMRVGDSCRIVVPYAQAYRETGAGTSILPYSNLQFDIKLVDIPFYETANRE